MNSLEPKKLALIRMMEILQIHSDYEHPLTQEKIADFLSRDYGITIERKAVSRNLSLLKESGMDIESTRAGSFVCSREFENAELHLLIDGILSSKHITAAHSKDLIKRISGLSTKYFKSGTRYIHTVKDWNKTENQSLFYNIEIIDEAIEKGRQIYYQYNKYGIDKKMRKTSCQYVSPYRMILHNQRYYLMAYSEYWGNMVFHRLDHMTEMEITDKKAKPLKSISGYEKGINYGEMTTALPYMYTDKQESIEFIADRNIIDQIIDWFGTEIGISTIKDDDSKIKVSLKASPNAMEHWATQYINYVEILSPSFLRERIKNSLEEAIKKYGGK